ncbi:MAG: ammonia-forming cytochrome c nitrite reductase subunit c552 [Candidatus Wallbacteria bacterium]|nr:ammonia-forming cytochrome c nitrite reductase subunit c552 [Candidatus Wallbacteria bacterium]
MVGTVSGQIFRSAGAGSSAAKLAPATGATISTDKGGYSTLADSSGNFSMILPASYYTLTVHSPGSRSVTLRDVPVLSRQETAVTSETQPLQPLGAADTDNSDPSRPVRKTYVGSVQCRTCHAAIYDAYSVSGHAKHTRYINDPVDKRDGFGVVADFTPDPGKPNRTLSLSDSSVGTKPVTILLRKTTDNRYFVTLSNTTVPGEFVYEARRTQGGIGEWKQYFETRIGGSWYVLPVQFNEKETDRTKQWVPFDIGTWYDVQGNVRQHAAQRAGKSVTVVGPAQKDAYERKCYGCHGTAQGLRRITDAESLAGDGDTGSYTIEATSVGVSCENCHGPGYPHVDTKDPNDIVNPSKNAHRTKKLEYARAIEVCAQCHQRGHGLYAAPSVAGLMETTADRQPGYPWTVDNRPFRLGSDTLAGAFDASGPSKYWNSKFTRNVLSFNNRQQWLDFQHSAHSTPEAQVTCFDCHNPHFGPGTSRRTLLRASAEDNTLCLQCHGKDGRAKSRFLLPGETSEDSSLVAITQHTRHRYDPVGASGPVDSRCVACHMPLSATSALKWDIAGHTFRPIKPVESLDMLDNGGDKSKGLVIPNSCASKTIGCHSSDSSPGGDFSIGNGDLRGNAVARAHLVGAVNAFESLFGTRKSTGTDVAGQLVALEGAVTLGGLPMAGARVVADRGEDYDETGEDGKFRLVVPRGTYNLYAVHPSFKTTSLEAVQATTAGAVYGGLKLALGAMAAGESQYVGSQKCKTCHAEKYGRWEKTLHNRGLRFIDAGDDRDPRFGVVADFGIEGVGRTITSTEGDFSDLGTAQIRLLRKEGVYTATLVNGDGSVAATYTIERTYGGGRGDWKQRFLAKIGINRYILPMQWSEYGPPGPASAPRWLNYHLSDNWFDKSTQTFSSPPAKGKRSESFEYQCIACHATGLSAELRAGSGEVSAHFVEMNNGCENCHGPGGSHYRTGDPAKIVNPDRLPSAQRKLDTCGICHARGARPPCRTARIRRNSGSRPSPRRRPARASSASRSSRRWRPRRSSPTE